MPGIEDWLHCPLDIIQNIYDQKPEHHDEAIKEYFTARLNAKNALSWIPSLNDTPLHDLKPNSIVRYRCMVQDMFDPEFFLGVYEVTDKNTGQSKIHSGKYKDIASCAAHQQVNVDSNRNVTMERQKLYCVPIPGETQWVKNTYSSNNQSKVKPSTSSNPIRAKRSLDTESDVSCDEIRGGSAATSLPNPAQTSGGDVEMETDAENKRPKTDENPGGSSISAPDLNFPLPREQGPPCLVKIYDDSDSIKLNDIFEFIGVLSIDPALANFYSESSEEQSSFLDPAEALSNMEEENVHSPPPSLVPRLHVILTEKLNHNNPLLPISTKSDDFKSSQSNILSEALLLKQQMLTVLERAVFGDGLAAEYLLCNLISSVYARRDVAALGKFSVNICGCPRASKFPDMYTTLLEQLSTKMFCFPMKIDSMNNMKFSPKKDYTANRLISGILQLAEQTLLVIDETVLESGQLNANGIGNLAALGNVVNWQKVEYDFNFHKQDFPCNIACLILSEGKSMINSDFLMPMSLQWNEESLPEKFSAIESFLTPALLTKLRTYLTAVQFIEYTLTDDVQKTIEEDFVELRKADAATFTVDDFHRLLTLARYLSLSQGQATLTIETWEHAKLLEQERKKRVASLPRTSVIS
ncbi:unnamed protein product [Owenia fusiformis]|uniref:Mini-chromosome maintenance complex-binding protein n=1 Tax=Owenia fusiformis TaxID=6347 RepID=A0A8S4NT47_OWEFU|nr:unnamed protein product [Owenia fusiformis]